MSATPAAGWPLTGQERARQYLMTALRRRRVASSYLFVGPNAVGKRTTASFVLTSVLCHNPTEQGSACGTCRSCLSYAASTHPDYHVLDLGEHERIGVDNIRSLEHELALTPSLGTVRAVLLAHAENLTPEAANALLKTLEEPPRPSVIVLTATLLAQLPLTVRSRCQIISFDLVAVDDIRKLLLTRGALPARARELAHLCMGRPGLALQLFDHPDEYDAYQQQVRTLTGIMEHPLHEQFVELETLLSAGPQTSAQVLPLLDIWQWILRDLLLLRADLSPFIVHHFHREALLKMSERFSLISILNLMDGLTRVKRLVAQNVQPRLALEAFAFSLRPRI